MTEPKEEAVFQLNQSMFQTLSEWQEKMEEINATEPEGADLSVAPKEEVEKDSPQTNHPD